MVQRAEFLDLFGLSNDLLHTSDARAIALIEPEHFHTFARVYVKDDGTVVLQAAEDIYRSPNDYTILVTH
jgi:hypothetical protein